MKIIIVGAGIAGLSAGIYAQKAGYDTVIYEKNEVAGGNCSGWYRDGYAIDNCLHWLTGTAEGTSQYRMWQELGVWKDAPKIVERDAFYTSELNGQKITLWRDVHRARQEMLALSEADAAEIHAFFDSVNLVHNILTSGFTPYKMLRAFTETHMELSHARVLRAVDRYAKMNMRQWANRFHHPLLRQFILDFSVEEYESYWLIMAYSFFAYRNGDIIEGGSIELVRRLVQNYKEAGGRLFLHTPVSQVLIDRTQKGGACASGVLLCSGQKVDADYVLCACDIHYTYRTLLQNQYTPRDLQKYYRGQKDFPVYSSFQAAYAVEGLLEEVDDTLAFSCEPFMVATQSLARIKVKNYRNYGDYTAPSGHTVIQCSFTQYAKDYEYWEKLYGSRQQYEAEKEKIAAAVQNRILARFPEYRGKIRLLDTWTPVSYARRNHDYMGAYMRFITTPMTHYGFLSGKVPKLKHLYLANHWMTYPGGVPTAAYMGKRAIMEIQKNLKF